MDAPPDLAPPDLAAPDLAALAARACAACDAARDAGVDAVCGGLSDAGFFALVHGMPFDKASRKALAAFRTRLSARDAGAAENAALRVAHHAVLRAFVHGMPALLDAAIDDSIKQQICLTAMRAAASPGMLAGGDVFGGATFAELARFATGRRYAAGQLSFDIESIPRAWLLKLHPADAARLLRLRLRCLQGPVIMPHINHWRPNRFFISEREQIRSLHILARVVRARPEIGGIVSSSWLYDPAVAQASPHLAWLDDFFLRHGALLFDAGPALPEAGFAEGNAARRALVESGGLAPRETIMIWLRADVLAWLREAEACSAQNAAPRGEKPRPRHPRSGELTLWNCRRALYYAPRPYIMAVFLPPLMAGLAAGMSLHRPVLGLFLAALLSIAAWLGQYFLLQ